MSEAERKEKEMPLNGGTEKSQDVKEIPNTLPSLDTKDASIPKTMDESDDKLDEFSRLELEMAELDKTDDGLFAKHLPCSDLDVLKEVKEICANKVVETEGKDLEKNKNAQVVHQNGQASKDAAISEPSTKANENEELFDHEDLIAVLKGDTVERLEINDKPKKLELIKDEIPSSTATISDVVIEGVTIEGEGEYQIMEVVDDIEDEADHNLPSTSKTLSTSLHASAKTSTGQKLTPEEERAMAMEQIAGLNARGPRRRKQDIKPLHIETSELVSTLGADWTDDDDDVRADDERPTSSKNAGTARKEILLNAQTTNQEVTSTESDAKSATISPVAGVKKRSRSVGPKISPSPLAKTAVAAETSNEVKSSTAESATPVPVVPEPIGATGFKRKRVIRRPLIYDPDVPETAFSYAQLVNSSARENRESLAASIAPKPRAVTPKDSTAGEKRGRKRAATPSQTGGAAKKNATTESNAKSENLELPSTSKQTQRAQSTSPDVGSSSSNSGPGSVNKKKKISEIDRLMGDEGAANMLHSLESGRGKIIEDSDNKPHKPLMRNRVGTAEKLSKKDAISTSSPPISTPKNKRALKPKASTSWDYVYQKQNIDDSMIIRRRSNSSYSSNASQHRLSLDGPSGLTSKSSHTKSSEQSSDEGSEISTSGEISTTSKPASKAVQKSGEEAVNAISNKSSNAPGNKNFEFAKPKDAKQNQKTANRRSKSNVAANTNNTLANDIKKAPPKRGRPSNTDRQANTEQTNAQSTGTKSPSAANSSNAVSATEEVIVRKIGKTAHIVFNLNSAQISCTFTPQLMNKIVGALQNLAEDVNCHVVVVTTNSSHFCQGVDYTNLATGSAEQRKTAAVVLATATKNFLRSLATFPKPLVAGIHGTIVGLGVTQLPLFDVVVSAESVSFETPYAKIGQTPEGFCIWQSSTKIPEATKTKLLWLAEKVSWPDIAAIEMVDKIVPSDRLLEETLFIAKKMSEMSAKTYRHMKNSAIEKRSEVISRALDEEFDEITAQWASAECFNKFKKSLEAGGNF